MTNAEPQHPTPEELAAIELGHALAGLGPDTDRALMLTLRLPGGRYVKDVWLSSNDVRALIDGAHAYSDMQAHAALAAPDPLPAVDLQAVTDVIAGFEGLLNTTHLHNPQEAEGDE